MYCLLYIIYYLVVISQSNDAVLMEIVISMCNIGATSKETFI
ncbi:hypothetical protein Mpsy_3034 [Methanolobus psychrophilus R15]|nr:hypothetical protein Mpsy_3034 [Methanolobus psychrophilus R15]